MQNALVQVKVDEKIKQSATEIYNELGLDLPTAIRIFLAASVKKNGLPFELNIDAVKPKKPNAKAFFGTMDDETYRDMMSALEDCSKVDEGEW